jgi:molybdenum cofactor guanylyltransferase
MKTTTSAIILCGGKERRFGSNKAKAIVGGMALIDRVIDRLLPVTDQIMVVTAPGKTDVLAEHKVELLTDEYPGRGPLGGIYTGLVAARHSYSIVVGCDMPFINTSLLRYMVESADGYDAVIPRIGKNMLEPLHAVYHKACIPVMQEALEKDNLSIYQITDILKVRFVESIEYLKFDPKMYSFFNINYPDDLDKAKQMAVIETSDSSSG